MNNPTHTRDLAKVWLNHMVCRAGEQGCAKSAKWALVAMLVSAWDDVCPMREIAAIESPSYGELESIAEAILRSVGIDPDEKSDSMLDRIGVRILHATPREELNLQRLRHPVSIRGVGVTNGHALIAVAELDLDQGNHLTVQFYRNAVGTAAVVLNQEKDRCASRCVAVYFTAQEGQNTPTSRVEADHLVWFVGWSQRGIVSGEARNKVWIGVGGAAANLPQLGFRALLRRLLGSLLTPLKQPTNRPGNGRDPRK